MKKKRTASKIASEDCNCATAMEMTERVKSVLVQAKTKVDFGFPGDIVWLASAPPAQLSVIPMAKLTVISGSKRRYMTLGLKETTHQHALNLLADAEHRMVGQDKFFLRVRADLKYGELLSEHKASLSIDFFTGASTKSVPVWLYWREDDDCGWWCPTRCHSHWHGIPGVNAWTACHGPCPAPTRCRCGGNPGFAICQGWTFCDCV